MINKNQLCQSSAVLTFLGDESSIMCGGLSDEHWSTSTFPEDVKVLKSSARYRLLGLRQTKQSECYMYTDVMYITLLHKSLHTMSQPTALVTEYQCYDCTMYYSILCTI